MGKANQLRSGVVLTYINMALGMVIPFVYTPLMLRMLGQSEYGLYSLSSSVVGYLSLLSFGFGNTVIRYISKYRHEGNKEAVERTYGFFIMLYMAMAVLVMICGIILANNVEPIFQKGLTDAEQAKMRTLVIIMAGSSAIAFPLSVFTSMVVSYEKFIFRQILNVFSTVFAPISNLIMLFLGYKSVGMALASFAVQAVVLPANIYYITKHLGIKPKFKMIEKSLFKEMVSVSFFHFLGAIVDMLFWSTDKVILGMLTSTTVVAIYNVGAHFNDMVIKLSSAITGVLAPKVTGMVVRNAGKNELTELFIRIGRVQFLIIGLISTGFIAFGRQFISLWVGNSYMEAYSIALLTLLPLCIPLIQNTGITILVAQNKHQFRAVVYFIIAIANVVSTWLIVKYTNLGGFGAALCSCISFVAGQGIVMNFYYWKKTGIDIPLFWRNILKMAIIPACMCVITMLGIKFTGVFTERNWIVFFALVFVYTAIYIFLMYKLAMNDYEKNILRKPVQAVIRKIKRK